MATRAQVGGRLRYRLCDIGEVVAVRRRIDVFTDGVDEEEERETV